MEDVTGTSYKIDSYYESSHEDYPLDKYFDLCDVSKFHDFKYFVDGVNKRAEWERGWSKEDYVWQEEGLRPGVEWFHPIITYDDRMVYIMENIVSLPNSQLSLYNKIGNTIISHFYGARGIHQVATGINDPKKAHVNFENYFQSGEREKIRANLEAAVNAKLPLYGSTELRTSLFGAANKRHDILFGDDGERVHPGNIMDWVAWLLENGIYEGFINSKSAEETFKVLTQHEGIGAYYGYHCTTSNSVNPDLQWDHDSNFVKPGPGCQYTLRLLFPTANNKLITGSELVVWFRHNQKFFGFGDINVHENAHNVKDYKGDNILSKPQTELATYNAEVGMCQYGIFCRIRDDNKAIDRRKVSRLEDVDVASIILAEKNKINAPAPITLESFME